MATTSPWTAWATTTTDAEPGAISPSPWTSWVTAATTTAPQAEWWVARAGAWRAAALFSSWGTEEPPPPPPGEIAHGSELTLDDVGLTDSSNLIPHSGTFTSTADGQDIENLDISVSSGTGVQVNHNGVTVRNCRIRHAGGTNGITVSSGKTGVVIERCEIDGMGVVLGNYGTIGVTGGTSTIRRNYFTRCRAAVTAILNGTIVEENWVTDLHRDNGSHGNSFSYHGAGTGSGVQFLRNRVEASNSGGLSFYAREGFVKNCEIRDNLVIGIGLGFGIYGGRVFTDLGHFCSNENIKIEGNRFSGTFAFMDSVGDGTNAGVDLSRPGNTFINNRWVGGTSDLPARCGVSVDACEGSCP